MTGGTTAEIRAILRRVELVLLDFDGPLCDVFAGFPAPEVARHLELISGEEFETDDPLEVLRDAARRHSSSLRLVEDELIKAEVRAVSCSAATDEGVAFLRACLSRGTRAGIVSNNSADAIKVFLDEHRVTGAAPVIGRAFRRPGLMKPDPWPIRTALTIAGVPARSTVYVGDSLTDIEAAQAVAMPCVAYANKPGKREQFEPTGALVIDSMSELSEALVALR